MLLQRSLPTKLIAVDLDNTVWPGVLLEGSWGTLHADCWGTHRLLQFELLRLQALGVLLVSLSRNDEAPVLAAWPKGVELVQALCRLGHRALLEPRLQRPVKRQRLGVHRHVKRVAVRVPVEHGLRRGRWLRIC